jgi:hypothetical protein
VGPIISVAISFTILTIPLIIFSDVKAIDAIKYSFQLCQNSPDPSWTYSCCHNWVNGRIWLLYQVFFLPLHVLDVLRDVQ